MRLRDAAIALRQISEPDVVPPEPGPHQSKKTLPGRGRVCTDLSEKPCLPDFRAFANRTRPQAAFKKGYETENNDDEAKKQVGERQSGHFQVVKAVKTANLSTLISYSTHICMMCNSRMRQIAQWQAAPLAIVLKRAPTYSKEPPLMPVNTIVDRLCYNKE